MRTVFKHIASTTYKPLLVKYLSKIRTYRYKNIQLAIPPEVFHPAFFTSTLLLLKYISKSPLQGKKLLELGAGSGLIAMTAVAKGAIATASDINPIAIEYLQSNSRENKIILEVIHSDLFANISDRQFDIILINPPYYKKQPQSWKDHAWYCGENGEYFGRLFSQLKKHIHNNSEVLIVLCDGCDLEMIKAFASNNDFTLRLMLTKQTLIEKSFIFKIEMEQ